MPRLCELYLQEEEKRGKCAGNAQEMRGTCAGHARNMRGICAGYGREKSEVWARYARDMREIRARGGISNMGEMKYPICPMWERCERDVGRDVTHRSRVAQRRAKVHRWVEKERRGAGESELCRPQHVRACQNAVNVRLANELLMNG